jgi:cytochrome c oxidase assembly factor CtaG
LQLRVVYAPEFEQNLLAHGIAPTGLSEWYLEWPFEPLVWVLVGLAAWAYLRGARRVPGWPAVRRLHWLAGLGVVVLALASPVAAYETALFSVHMVQHVLLTMVAAPLLLLGAPVTLTLRATSPRARRRLTALMGSKVVHMVTHPVVTWLFFVGIIVLTHFSDLYNASLENEWLHLLEHALYFGSAVLFWWPIIGVDPSGHRLAHPLRMIYLLLTMPVQAFVALAIYSSGTVLYKHYETLQRSWGPNVLDDQRGAAVVMWVGGDGLVLLSLALTILAWMRYDDRLAARIDRRANVDGSSVQQTGP